MSWGHPHYGKVTLFVGDMLLTVLVIMVLLQLRRTGAVGEARNVVAVVTLLLTYLASFYIFDLYNLHALNGVKTIYRLVVACGVATAITGTLFYFVPSLGNQRGNLMLSAPILVGMMYAWRHVYVHATDLFASKEPILVIGSPRDADTVHAVVGSSNSRYDLLGFLLLEKALSMPSKNDGLADGQVVPNAVKSIRVGGRATSVVAVATAPARVLTKPESDTEAVAERTKVAGLGLATAQRIQELVAEYNVRSLVVRSDSVSPELATALTRLRFEGIRVHTLPDFYMKLAEELPLEVLTDMWLSFANGFDMLSARLFRRVKRLTDLLFASVSLLVALPVMLLAALAIKLDSRGPVLFRQRRVGWLGQPFELLKLRSMRNDAEGDGRPQWASVDDPRVTAVGRFLRKFRLDELPQMLNILRGQMSFVGPRPERPEFVEQLTDSVPFYHLRHYVPPGITGWAQVKYPYGASLEDARRKLQFDLYYICNASLLLDLRILLRTTRVVLFRQGSR